MSSISYPLIVYFNPIKIMGDHYTNASRMVNEKGEQLTDSIKERPLTWVAGAFLTGLTIGVIAKTLHEYQTRPRQMPEGFRRF